MKKRLNRLWEWIKTRWKWYVLGYYHCDQCPYSWSEYSYEGDGDCGCYIKGELWDTCRLLPPFRFLIGWPRKRQFEYHEAHAWDGIGDWYEENAEREEHYAKSVLILLKEMELYQRDCEGKMIPVCKADLVGLLEYGCGQIGEAYRYYEDHAHPVKVVPLKERWKETIKLTWKHLVYDHIAPYLPRKRRKRNDY